jgi:CheY-like chemotaxis protein
MKDLDQKITILLAEDDSNTCLLVEQAFQEIGWKNAMQFVSDGIELMQYLRHLGRFAAKSIAPRPDLILLDLNMPNLDGRQALAEIKADPDLRGIPVVVLTNSHSQMDVLLTYNLGGAGYIIKPDTFNAMVDIAKVLSQYWFEVVELANGDVVHQVMLNHRASPTTGLSRTL